jgi:hypothetical protein
MDIATALGIAKGALDNPEKVASVMEAAFRANEATIAALKKAELRQLAVQLESAVDLVGEERLRDCQRFPFFGAWLEAAADAGKRDSFKAQVCFAALLALCDDSRYSEKLVRVAWGISPRAAKAD